MSMLSKLYKMMGSDELEQITSPAMVLVETLALYPANRPLETAADLEAFLRDDERLRLSLSVAVDQVAALPIWSDAGELADLPADCRDGLAAWFDDVRRFVALHDSYTKELAAAAAESARLALSTVAATPKGAAGGDKGPSPESPSGDVDICACGRPATSEFFGIPICSTCAEAATKVAGELLEGGGKP